MAALFSPLLKEKALCAGDEVIVPATSFPTTIAPLIQYGLCPVYIDTQIETYNPSIEQIEQAVGPKTKAIMLAHTLGNPAPADLIAKLCKEKELFFIEDCCDALGSTLHLTHVGRFGDLATCSFYPAHHITMGEGGMISPNDSFWYPIVESLRSWGKDCWCLPGEQNSKGACNNRFNFHFAPLPAGYDHKYTYTHLGYNLKPLDVACAIGRVQLKKLPLFVQKRKENFQTLFEIFSCYQDWWHLPVSLKGADPSWFAFPLTLKKTCPFTRQEIVEFLEQEGIETRMLFGGNITFQPAFKNSWHRKVGSLETSTYLMNNTFFIGLYPGIGDEEVEYIKKTVSKWASMYAG